ncbi:hypothetical protein [Streptomyces sp. NPDC059979]|uniref:hypothetical protein n=1 Tax=unclassified Streptomyces TaxID=2593676 RepID=UPI0036475D11
MDAELLVAEALDETGRIEEAVAWYQRAAESGYPSARSALARLATGQAAPEQAR